jgi:hypothetical protein
MTATTNTETGLELTLQLSDGQLGNLAKRIAELVAAELALRETTASPWMDVPGVAAYAVMTDQAVRDAEKNGHLRAHRTTTGRLRFHIDDVEAFMKGVTP